MIAQLKIITDFITQLIGAEGARLLREYGAGETPQALIRRGGSPARPRKAKRLELQSTAKFTEPINLYMNEVKDVFHVI